MSELTDRQDDNATLAHEEKAKNDSQTDRRELLKMAVATAAATMAASGEAKAALTSVDHIPALTEAEKKKNIERFLNLQARRQMGLLMRARKGR